MLNILPLDYKTALQQSAVYRQVRRLGTVAMLTSVVLGGLLLSTEWLLERWQTTLVSTNAVGQITQEERQTLETLITDLQQASTAGQTTSAIFRHPLADIAPFFQAIPDDIQLHSIMLDYEATHLRLTGTATNRESLVNYQKQLADYTFLQNIVAPISDLSVREQIPFSIDATVTYD